MRTVFYRTSNFIQHRGNVVDLEEYRRRTAQAQQDSLARADWEPEPDQEDGFQPIVLTMDKKARRRARRERRGWVLDACASVGVIVMTLVFLLRLLL